MIWICFNLRKRRPCCFLCTFINDLVFWCFNFRKRRSCYFLCTFILPRHFPTHIIYSAELIRHQKVLFQIETFVSNYVRNDIQNCFVLKKFSMSINIWCDNAQNISHSLKFGADLKLTKFPPSGSKWTAMFSQRPLRSPDWSPSNHQLSK